MIHVVRKRLYKDEVVDKTEYEFEDMIQAVDIFDKLHKIDLGYYQRYVTEYSHAISNCDDGHYYGISYYFVIDDVSIECEILEAEEISEERIFI